MPTTLQPEVGIPYPPESLEEVIRQLFSEILRKHYTLVVADDVEVTKRPSDEDLPSIIYTILKVIAYNVYSDEIIEGLRGFVGEDKIRKTIRHLLGLGKITVFPDGSIGVRDAVFIPRRRRLRYRMPSPHVYKSIPKEVKMLEL